MTNGRLVGMLYPMLLITAAVIVQCITAAVPLAVFFTRRAMRSE